MGKFFSTLMLGLIAAIIGATIQQRTWRHRALVELKEQERSEARQAVETLSKMIDERLEAQRMFTIKTLQRELNDEDVNAYKVATSKWMGGYSSNISRIYHSFGSNTVRDFENNIQARLQYSSAIVGLGRKLGSENLSTKDRSAFHGSEHELSLIQRDIYLFLRELNEKISAGDIGRTKAINNLSANDPSMISRVYLIRRLLGIEGNIRRANW